MASSNKKPKRKIGRPPKQKYFSADELRVQAYERMKRSESINKEQLPDKAEELYIKTLELNQYKRLTLKEINELREQVSEVYLAFKAQQEEAIAQEFQEINKVAAACAAQMNEAASTSQMTEAEWHKLHGRRPDGSKPRGPKPKKKKLVWELEPGEKGTALEPSAPIDIEAMEKVLEQALIERHLEQQEEEAKFLKGKRLREPTPARRAKTDQSRFYN